MDKSRAAGLGLVVYAVGTLTGFLGVGAPGGEYHPDQVATYMSAGHQWTAFGFGYLGALSALGLLVFGHHARSLWPRVGEVIWPLTITATAVSIVGGFVTTGVVVAFTEAGDPVRQGVAPEVVAVFGEVGNLLALCGPAFFMGVAALVLARRAPLPTWLRVLSVVGGLSGILLPFYFTIPVYLLWVLALGVRAVAGGARAGRAVRLQESFV